MSPYLHRTSLLAADPGQSIALSDFGLKAVHIGKSSLAHLFKRPGITFGGRRGVISQVTNVPIETPDGDHKDGDDYGEYQGRCAVLSH